MDDQIKKCNGVIMKYYRTNILLLGALAFSLASCTNNLTTSNATSQSVNKGSSTSTPSNRAVGERVYSLVNAKRAQAGKKALRGNSGLNSLAQKQANYLAQNAKLGKASTLGSHNRAQYALLRYNVENVTEITNSTSSDNAASETVAEWMNSSEHRRTLLQSWSHTGIGSSRGPDGRTYITMLVGVNSSGVPRSVTPVGW